MCILAETLFLSASLKARPGAQTVTGNLFSLNRRPLNYRAGVADFCSA